MKRRHWNILEALDFVRDLEHHLGGDYHVALTGSVLIKGSSRKDVDIMVYPHDLSKKNYSIRDSLKLFGMDLELTSEQIREKWGTKGSTDTKHVEMWTYEGKRVDVFFPWISCTPIKHKNLCP